MHCTCRDNARLALASLLIVRRFRWVQHHSFSGRRSPAIVGHTWRHD